MSQDSQLLLANRAKYQPKPATERHGIALCLSGGGYRAALFHLGAVRRLNELGILGQFSDISSVSGGSIFAAFLALRVSQLQNGKFPDYENTIAVPFRAFTKNDIRTWPAIRRTVLPWEWFNAGAQSAGLQDKYETLLTRGARLRDLPAQPAFHFNATDLAFGVDWTFTRDKVGDYQAGHMDPNRSGSIPLAQAVAASSCFPPVFKPMPLKLQPGDLSILGEAPAGADRDECIRQIALSDGGVYDNMGLEPVWKTAKTVLVCDGGKPFGFFKKTDSIDQLLRIIDVMGNQAEAVRKRWLIDSFLRNVYGGTYWRAGGSVADYNRTDTPGYSKGLATDTIAAIRTDMDRFSDDEAAVLENHGYSLAEAAIKTHVPDLYSPVPLQPPAPRLAPSLAPDALKQTEQTIRQLLKESAHVRLFGH